MTRSARWLRFIEGLKIRTSDRRVVNLRYNSTQQKVWATVAEKIDRLEPIRLIILKARREGISTAIESWLMTLIASGDLVNALVTAHMAKPARKIWGMSKLFVSSSPLLSRLAVIGNNTITIGRSTLEVATAGSPESERGGDLTAWHASEAAQYPHPQVMIATMQALPQRDDIFSIGVIESTANGKVGDGELFYEEWTRAQEGDSDWLALFLAWHEFLDYQLPRVAIEQPTIEEFALRERFELTDAQLAWRRWAIRNKCGGDADLFRQEYPSTSEEAFITSGLPFFRPEQLLPLERHVRHGQRGTVETDGRFVGSTGGPIEVFVFPKPGHQYVIGADSSMGMEDEEGKSKHSRSAACVLDMETLEQAAEYDAVTPPHIMARHLVGLGRLYNEALLAPEIQSSGGGGGREMLVFIHELNYWNLHRYRHIDRVQREAGVMYGWECLDVDARVLTADLQWIAARQIKAGDRVVGCQEACTGGKGSGIPIRLQTVVQRRVFVAPMVEVILENGQQTRVTATHPFLTFRRSRRDIGWRWRVATEIRPGDCVKCLPMWETLRTYEAGRLSAFLDGEGHLARSTRRGGYQMLVTQVEGELAQEIRELWSNLGFTATFKWLRHKDRHHEQDIASSGVLRLTEVLRALGSLRPTRLLRKFSTMAEHGMLTLRAVPNVAVASVESIGDGPVVGLTTYPDHTLIADGIVGHNTNARTRPRMLARIREAVMEQSVTLHSRRLFNQLAGFGENDAGRMEGQAGHDDLLFAFGIALCSRSENYYKQAVIAPSTVTPDWQSLGLRVLQPESPQDRLQRILAMGEPMREKDFMEL